MKNIHLISTDKPSRLWTNNLKRRLELDEFPSQHPTNIAKNIYITSDVEIKEGDYIIELDGNEVFRSKGVMGKNDWCKKIILTDNQDLIKDGVQSIDDEFLEWFVKNVSCEEVEVGYGWIRLAETDNEGYWVSIPDKQFEMQQEEPKEVLCGEANKFYRCITCDAPCGSEGHYIEVTEEQSNNDMNKILWISNNPQCKLIESCYNSLSKKCICPKEEPKQYPIGGYAPGYYSCTCVTCKKEFTGDKRAVQCEPCAIKMTKEEPKQDLEKEMFELEQELDIPSSMRWHNSKPKQEIKLEDIFNDEKKQGVKDLIDAHKQETTLEEVAKWSLEKAKEFALERFKSDRKKAIVTWDSILEVLKVGVKTGHKFGTKHQAERMYSEEDMRGMYDKSCGLIGLSLLNDQTENDSRFKKLLEQFKKK